MMLRHFIHAITGQSRRNKNLEASQNLPQSGIIGLSDEFLTNCGLPGIDKRMTGTFGGAKSVTALHYKISKESITV